MKLSFVSFGTALGILLCCAAATSTARAAPTGSLAKFISADCDKDELGKVTAVKVIDAKAANAEFKKGKAPQIAKPGETWVLIFAASKTNPKDLTMDKVDAIPTAADVAAVVGQPQCTTGFGR